MDGICLASALVSAGRDADRVRDAICTAKRGALAMQGDVFEAYRSTVRRAHALVTPKHGVQFVMRVVIRNQPECYVHAHEGGYVVARGTAGAVVFSLRDALGCISQLKPSWAFQMSLCPLLKESR